jgi:predicted O-methyltransferase YrrM
VREVKELRGRVTALESSRWWGVHPRFLLRRLRGLLPADEHGDDGVETLADWERTPTPVAPLTGRFLEEVVARGSFRVDMVSINFATWEPYLKGLEGRSARILEIGSFEGMSACYFLWRLPDAHVTCIDTFTGGPSFAALAADVSGMEEAFDRNVSLVDAGRVRKLVGDSGQHLLALLDEGSRFDFVFVEGSDLALDVLVDAALSWQMLIPGGHMVFDNYLWRSPLGEDPLFQPAPAVHAFVDLVGNHCQVLVQEKEFILRRADAVTPVEAETDRSHPAPRSARPERRSHETLRG